MKLIKGLAALLTAFIVLSGMVRADGVTPLRLIMSEEAWVKNYWASNVYFVRVSMFQNGKVVGKSSYDYYAIKGFADLCDKVRLNAVKVAESGLKTNTVNKELPLTIVAGMADVDVDNPVSFQSATTFKYDKAGNDYTIPQILREITPRLEENLSILALPGITWARMIVSDQSGVVITNFDSLDGTTNLQIVGDKYLRTSREFACGSVYKITVFVQENDRYHKFNGNTGLEIEFEKPKSGIVKSLEGIAVIVKGDPFQGFIVESTTNLREWSLEGYGMTSASTSNQWKLLVEKPENLRFFKVTPVGLSNAQRGHLMGR